ncbi:kelch-like protein 25 isoform X2 [Arctopsyche grandis]
MFLVKAKFDFAAKRIEYLYDAMKHNQKCDTGFTVRDKTFHAHLIILMACSKFFGTNEGQVEDIMSKYQFEVIEAILKYCYTGEINIEEKHRKNLLELANKLKVKIPPQFKTVNLSNCLKVFKLTDDSELKTKAKDLILENFKKMSLHTTPDFLKLLASDVVEILKSDDLDLSSEEDVFNSVKLWINHDYTKRKNELAKLMRSVRLSLLSLEFLVNEVMKFCVSCEECLMPVRQAIIGKDNKSLIQEKNRRRKEKKIALVGGKDIDVANTIDIYDGQMKNWSLSENIGINKSDFESVIVGESIVIIGGLNSSNESVTSVEYIDLKNGQKFSLKPLNIARYKFSAATLRRGSSTDVYAIGGNNDDDDVLSSVERWNSETGDWQIITSLLVAVEYHSATVVDEKIYITGGQTYANKKITSLNKVQMYSVETNSWTYRAQMIQERSEHSSVAFRGKLYVAGGTIFQTSTYLDSVEHYDPNANLWTPFTNLPRPVSGVSLFCFQKKLLTMGGNSSSDVCEYEETSKTWKALKSLTKMRAHATAHIIPFESIIKSTLNM